MANRGHEGYQIGFPRQGRWKVRLNSDWVGYDPEFGNHPGDDTMAEQVKKDGMPCNGKINIGPYSAIVLSQDT